MIRIPFYLLGLLTVSISGLSQSVGIGTPNPGAKLQINHSATAQVPTLLLLDSAVKGTPGIRFKNLTTNSHFEIKSVAGATGNSSFLDITHSSSISPVFTIKGDGNVGIGNANPVDRLNVEGSTSLNGPLHVTGNTNIQGQLLLNGSAGAAGQVLTSNGAVNPVWAELATSYPANGRIMIPVSATPFPGQVSANLNLGTPIYNTFGSSITVSDTSITFNTTGLYELEGKLFFKVGLVSVDDIVQTKHPYATMRIQANYGSITGSYLQISEMIDKSGASGSNQLVCAEVIPFKFVSHITSGTVINFSANISQYTLDNCCDPSPRISEGYIGVLKIN